MQSVAYIVYLAQSYLRNFREGRVSQSAPATSVSLIQWLFSDVICCMNNIIYTPLCTIQQIYYIHNVVQMQLMRLERLI